MSGVNHTLKDFSSPVFPFGVRPGLQTDDLFRWWAPTHQESAKLKEFSGQTDAVDGTITGSAWAGSEFGPVLRFTADSDMVALGDASILPTAEATVVLLYRKTDTTNRNCDAFGLATGHGSGQKMGAHIPEGDGGVKWDFGGNSEGSTRITASGLALGTDWHHWVFSAGPRGMDIWMDGALRASHSSPVTRSAAVGVQFTLGRHGWDVADRVEIADFRVYTKQLSTPIIAEMGRAQSQFALRRSIADDLLVSIGGGAAPSGNPRGGDMLFPMSF